MLTKVVAVSATNPEPQAIREAARAVREGGLVVFPTETVYGIAANALDPKALEKLYAVKGRPKDKPFSWHISSIDQFKEQASDFSPQLAELAAAFWPGPLTLVVDTHDGGKTGFRMPAHPVALALIRASGVPIVAPSANLSGQKSPTSAEEALASLDGKVDLVLDAGKTEWGQDSTVVDLTQRSPKILRAGAITEEQLNKWFREHGWKK